MASFFATMSAKQTTTTLVTVGNMFCKLINALDEYLLRDLCVLRNLFSIKKKEQKPSIRFTFPKNPKKIRGTFPSSNFGHGDEVDL